MTEKQAKMIRWGKAAALMLCAAGLCLLSAGGGQQQSLAERVVRLHVIANSDSQEDQTLKLQVRDAVLAEAEPLLEQCRSRSEAEGRLREALPRLAQVGQQAAAQAGKSERVTARLTESWFPTRYYSDFALPCGYYHTLRITIGAGKGHNWWCVVYPPLCRQGVEETVSAACPLDEEQVELITRDSEEYVLRFRCAEWWGAFSRYLPSSADGGDRSPAD